MTVTVTVKVNEAAIRRFMNSTTGPVGIDIAARAGAVMEIARNNASGGIIGVDTGALLSGITARVEGTPVGVRGIVSTDAVARDSSGRIRTWRGAPFSYPAFHDVGGAGEPGGGRFRWLTDALIRGFRLGAVSARTG